MSTRSRITLAAAVAVAFVCGLVFASGFNLTRLGFAQALHPEFASTAPTPPPAEKTAEALSDAFEWVAKTVTPAVVSIQAVTDVHHSRNQVPHDLPPGMEQFFHQFQMPENTPEEASGTGFIVSSDGYILTNNHVVAENGDVANTLKVTLLDRRTYTAKIIGRDSTTDVALIKIDAHNLPTVVLGNDSSAKVGQWVLAIGNPLGLNFTVTSGIVSAKNRPLNGLLNTTSNQWAISDFIQTDAAINPGNSGGPLVNLQGQVIGINSALASGTGYFAGYGFAIPISLAKRVMEDFIKYGHVRRAVLGVSIGEVSQSDADAAGMKRIYGATVEGFTPARGGKSPAEVAGVQPADVIVSVDGDTVSSVAALQRIIRNFEPGQTVQLGVMEHGTKRTISVKLGEPPGTPATTVASNTTSSPESNSGTATAERRLGISVESIPQNLVQQDSIPADYQHGLLVANVSSKSPVAPTPTAAASNILLSNQDIIIRSLYPEKMEIHSVADLDKAVSAVKKGEYLQLYVYNVPNNQTRVVNVQMQ